MRKITVDMKEHMALYHEIRRTAVESDRTARSVIIEALREWLHRRSGRP